MSEFFHVPPPLFLEGNPPAVHAPHFFPTSGSEYFREVDEDSELPERESVLFLCEEVGLASALRQNMQDRPFTLVRTSCEQLATQVQTPVIFMELSTCPWPFERLKQTFEEHYPDVPVVLMDLRKRMPEELKPILPFVFSYRRMPCTFEVLLRDLECAVSHRRFLEKNARLSASVGIPVPEYPWLSTQDKRQRKQIATFAKDGQPVLIQGERGSGQQMIAQQIHRSGPRRDKPFVLVPCGAMPPLTLEPFLFGASKGCLGRLELAGGGTIYFDRIEDLPLMTQKKLDHFLRDGSFFRVGENRPLYVDVQVLAGTETDLATTCLLGNFLRNTYQRLAVQTIPIPPLRECVGNIPELARDVLSEYARQHGVPRSQISEEATARLQRYSWPGNLQEFRQVLTRACPLIEGGRITERDIQFDPTSRAVGGLAGMTLEEMELRLILETLAANGNNKAMTARLMRVSEKTVYNKLKEHNLLDKISLERPGDGCSSPAKEGE